MLNIQFANRYETLSGLLLARLAGERADVFVADVVVVPSAAAMPPWAYAVAESNRVRLVSTVTEPCPDALQAVWRPATPLPTTRNRVRIRRVIVF